MSGVLDDINIAIHKLTRCRKTRATLPQCKPSVNLTPWAETLLMAICFVKFSQQNYWNSTARTRE